MIPVPNEEWRVVPSLPDVMVSNWGRLMVRPRQGKMPHGGKRQYGGTAHWGVWERIQRRYIYQYQGKTYRVHRLICEAFHGAPPFERAVVMHKDENPTNNRPENLEWGTQKQNLNAPGFRAYAAETCKDKMDGKSPGASA